MIRLKKNKKSLNKKIYSKIFYKFLFFLIILFFINQFCYGEENEFLIDTNVVYMEEEGYQRSPSVAFDGTDYLVVWEDYRNNSWDIYGARVDTSGIVLDPSGIPISVINGDQEEPSVAFDGVNYLVVWQDNRNGSDYDIYCARVSKSGIVIDTLEIPVCTALNHQKSPSVLFDGRDYLIVWEDYRNGYYSDIYGVRLDTSGIILDSFPVSTQSKDQLSPVIASGSGQFLIIYSGWTDAINGHPVNTMRIWGHLLSFTGIEDERKNIKIIFSDYLVIKGLEDKKIKVYDITGSLCGEYYGNRIGYNLKNGIYFIKIKERFYKVIKIR